MADLVPSREAARMYGVNVKSLGRALRAEGVAPVIRPASERHGGVSHWWNPMEVLRARAIRAERTNQCRARFTVQRKTPTNYRLSRILARDTLAERFRNKLLAPLALERGMTVKALRIDLGIDKA